VDSRRANVVLCVIIIFLVITLAIPFIEMARVRAAKQTTIDTLKHLTLALEVCNDTHGKLPPAFDRFANIDYPCSLHVHLLPFVHQDEMYRGYLQKGGGNSHAIVPLYLAASDTATVPGNGIQNFAGNLRVFSKKGLDTNWEKDMSELAAVEPGAAMIPRTFQIGTSNSVVFATKYRQCGSGGSHFTAEPNSEFAAFFGQNAARIPADSSNPRATFQLAPNQVECLARPLMAQSFTDDVLITGLADGSVRTFKPTVDVVVWNRALQPNAWP